MIVAIRCRDRAANRRLLNLPILFLLTRLHPTVLLLGVYPLTRLRQIVGLLPFVPPPRLYRVPPPL